MLAFSLRMRVDPLGSTPQIPDRTILRREIEAQIERLIAALDTMDADQDAEDDGCAEPSLGWTATMAIGNSDDREPDLADAPSDLETAS